MTSIHQHQQPKQPNELLQQALSQDLSILKVLLQRHRCSHGRALYFRRISMVLQATERVHLLEMLGERFEQFRRNAIDYSQQETRKRNRSSNNKGASDDRWDITTCGGGTSLTKEQARLNQDYQALEGLYTESFAELLSRIDHASTPLFLEVSRGFFLPFCTVALGALARVRTVLLRMGRYGLSQLQELISSEEPLRKFLVFSKTKFEATMTQYLEGDKSSSSLSSSSLPSGSATGMSGGVVVGMVSSKERRPNLVQSLGYSNRILPTKLSNESSTSAKNESTHGEETELENKHNKVDDESSPYAGDDRNQEPFSNDVTRSAAANQEANSTTHRAPQSTASMAAAIHKDHDDDDIGESLTFSRDAPVVDDTMDSTAGKGARTTATAQLPSTTTDETDRNMELVASFKSSKGKSKGNNKRGSEKVGGTDKKSKRPRKEDNALSVTETKKKKTKKKGKKDFFDALFD